MIYGGHFAASRRIPEVDMTLRLASYFHLTNSRILQNHENEIFQTKLQPGYDS